ncbi:MAG: ABC transporter permease, partial [Blastocatellia bacterium]
AARASAQFPLTNGGRGVNVLTITQDATRGSRMYAPVMLGSVAFVLLIACTNVANLMLVRGAGRQKEIAIRLAMGATRWRLIRQLLTESLLLSFTGGASGLLLSVWGVRALSRGIPEEFSRFIPGWHNLVINRTAFLFTLVISVVSGLLFGLVPAIQSTRTSFNEALKEGGKGSPGKASRNRARNAMVVAEVALSLVLLIGSGLLIRSFVEMMRSDFGIEPANVLTIQVSLPGERYEKAEPKLSFYDQLLRRVEALPGVIDAGATAILPMSGNNFSRSLESAGQTTFPESKRPNVLYSPVTTGYFAAIGTRVIRGRNFTEGDRAGGPGVALVDRAFVRQFFPDRDPIGEQFKETGGAAREIIGVVTDVMNEDFDEMRDSHYYVPYSQETLRGMYLIIRASSDAGSLTSAVRAEVSALDNTLPVFNVKPMEQLIKERMSPKRLVTVMMLVFAVIALVLAAVGIYAVMSFAVSQRTHEIGIRMALGARPRDIFKLIVGQGVTLTLVGIGAGLAGAFAMTRAMSGLLYGVTATDPLTYAGISLLLGAVGLAACCVPTRRATKVDPMVALRYE